MEVALKNKIPTYNPTTNLELLMRRQSWKKVDQLLADSRSIYKDKPIEQRQIRVSLWSVYWEHEETGNQLSAGYLTIELFDKQYPYWWKVSNLLKQGFR